MGREWITYWAPPLWKRPETGAGKDTVDEAERKLGVRLPKTLRAMLSNQNGGPLRGWHEHATQDHAIRGIGVGHFGLEEHDPWWNDDDYWQPAEPIKLLVPMSGDGHSDLCLDYRRHGPAVEPAVTLVDCESELETSVAASFDGFLQQIVPAEVGFVVSGNQLSAADVAERLGTVCSSAPRETDTGRWIVDSRQGPFHLAQNRLHQDGPWFRIPEEPIDGLALVLSTQDYPPTPPETMWNQLHTVGKAADLL